MYMNTSNWKLVQEKSKILRSEILRWVYKHMRDFPWRRTNDPYVVLVTEKLLQQTDYGHVKKVWYKFFEKFPTVDALAQAEEEEIAEILRPLGLWRQRAKQLNAIAGTLVAKFGGQIPCNYKELLSLPGVGDYVARATLVFACEIPTYLIDVNTKKIVQRFIFYPTQVTEKEVAKVLEIATPKSPRECKLFNWGMIDFSALVCTRKPKCDICPLRENCAYYSYIING